MTTKTNQTDYYQSGLYQARLQKRYAKEQRFKIYGMLCILFSFLMIITLLTNIISTGYLAFLQNKIFFEIDTQERSLNTLTHQEIQTLILDQLMNKISSANPQADSALFLSSSKLEPILSANFNYLILAHFQSLPSHVNQIKLWVPTSDEVDQYIKHPNIREESILLPSFKKAVNLLLDSKQVKTKFNLNFLTHGDSIEAEHAGIASGLFGSIFLIVIVLLITLPVGIGASFYLEEFAPKSKLTDFIEININNLAAIPSIIFGLLGLSILIDFLDMTRSTALVGGIVLSMMTLPTIIITSRLAIRSVPKIVKEAAFGLGASKVQVMLHHTLPLSLPGIMTGTIISLARAMGETAPLLMIGMVAFIATIPTSINDATAALPVQIYIWATNPEPAFIEKSSGAIMVLLALLICFNAAAVYIRQKYEKQW